MLQRARIADSSAPRGKAKRGPHGDVGAPRLSHPGVSLVCLPGFSKRAEFDANAAKSRFIERLGHSWQIAECRGKLIEIVVARGKYAPDARADQLRNHH